MEICDPEIEVGIEAIVIEGEPTQAEIETAWDKIVSTNSKAGNSMKYDNHVRNVGMYRNMLADINAIRGTCLLLWIEGVDDDNIAFLKSKGYKIDTENGNTAYYESITACLTKSKNLLSKLESKGKEINQASEGQDKKYKALKFAQVLARLHEHFPHAPTDITLELFNEYNKIISEKAKSAQSNSLKSKRDGR